MLAPASGLLLRDRNRSDERSLAVTLTDRGRALRNEAEKVPPAVVATLGMELDELHALRQSLTRVIDAVE